MNPNRSPTRSPRPHLSIVEAPALLIERQEDVRNQALNVGEVGTGGWDIVYAGR